MTNQRTPQAAARSTGWLGLLIFVLFVMPVPLILWASATLLARMALGAS